MMTEWDYTRSDLVEGLRTAGIAAGDTMFVHVCIETLGQPKGCATTQDVCEMLLGALQEMVGPNGTILVPTYTFSFCRHEVFDMQRTPTSGGPWSTFGDFLEYVRQLPDAVRSRDPIHSVVGLGPGAADLLNDVPPTCFGAGSVFDRLRRAGGKICMIGVGLHEASFMHHAEEMAQVPFRFKKLFTGSISDDGATYKAGWIYNVRAMTENSYPDASRLEAQARASGICWAARVGRGEVLAVASPAYFDLITQELARDPWYTAKGPPGDVAALERERVGGPQHTGALSRNASMEQMIGALWRLPRDIVSTGYDAALAALATQVPMTIHEYPTGTECWTWIVPEQWTCHEAYLETLDGRRLFSYADHPLHVVSYSLPFEGDVTRDVLFEHLHTHHQIAEAVPFEFKYYERDWGLCCSKTLKESLTDERYRVVIRTSFSYSTLKVGEVVVPSQSDETIVLCTHLCHPAMVNDDLTGVVVGINVIRELLTRHDLRYTYRLLILPETIGSVAYLSHHEELIPKMKGGLFLEMLGREYPHALQLSFDGATDVDQCFTQAMRQHDVYGWTGAFRTIIGNDERQFNAPGVRVPMLSLSRVLPPSARDWPYRGYHSNYDTPDRISIKSLDDSCNLVLQMIDTLEHNYTPVNNFKGEVFCSRYGVHVNWWINPEGNKALFDIMYLIDGTRSVAEIADACGISFDAARQTIDMLCQHGIVCKGA